MNSDRNNSWTDIFKDAFQDGDNQDNIKGWDQVSTTLIKRRTIKRVLCTSCALPFIVVLCLVIDRNRVNYPVVSTVPTVAKQETIVEPSVSGVIEDVVPEPRFMPATNKKDASSWAPITIEDNESSTIEDSYEEDERSKKAMNLSKNQLDERFSGFLDEKELVTERQRMPISIAVSAKSIFVGSSSTNSAKTVLKVPGMDAGLFPLTHSHHMRAGAGISIDIPLLEHLSLVSGCNYSLLQSEIIYPGQGENYQILHMIGIPVHLAYSFIDKENFSVYGETGWQAEKCLFASYGGIKISEPSIQWSVDIAAGIQYKLSRNIGLYFQPEFSYYLTDTRLTTYRSKSHCDFNLRAGIRFSL